MMEDSEVHGFRITFTFSRTNPFFYNRRLVKEYHVNIHPKEMNEFSSSKLQESDEIFEELSLYKGPRLVEIKGNKIEWVAQEKNKQLQNNIELNSLVSFFQFSWVEEEGYCNVAEKDYMVANYLKDIMIPCAYVIYKDGHSSTSEQQCKYFETCKNKIQKPTVEKETSAKDYNTNTPIPSSKNNELKDDHSSNFIKQTNDNKAQKINNLFNQLLAELTNNDTNESLTQPKVTPMPSSGWTYSSDSEKPKEKNILEALLEDANNESKVPVTFENVTGLNHRSRSEELLNRGSFPIECQTDVRKSKSHHVYPTYNKPLLKKVSPISSSSSLESDDVDKIVESLIKGKTNVSIAELTQYAKDDSSIIVSSSQCSISTISEPATASIPNSNSSVDFKNLKDEKKNEICLTSSTGECNKINLNKKSSRKRRLPCESGSSAPIEHTKVRKTHLTKKAKNKLKEDPAANDEGKSKGCRKRKMMDSSNNTIGKKQKLGIEHMDKACQTARKKRGFFTEILMIYKDAFKWAFLKKKN